jgi:hypothetical protein
MASYDVESNIWQSLLTGDVTGEVELHCILGGVVELAPGKGAENKHSTPGRGL